MRAFYPRTPYRYRHNPGLSAMDLADLARSMGKLRIAAALERGGPVAEAFVQAINAEIGEEEEVIDEDTALTDAQAWGMLADLVPTALSDQPKALQDALVAAFREEARRAA